MCKGQQPHWHILPDAACLHKFSDEHVRCRQNHSKGCGAKVPAGMGAGTIALLGIARGAVTLQHVDRHFTVTG